MADLLRRGQRGAIDYFGQGHSDVEDFIHRRQHIHHHPMDIMGMQVCTDGIRTEAIMHGRDRISKPKAARSMAKIENNAALSRLEEKVVGVTRLVHNRELLGVDVGVDVTGLHLLQNQLWVGAFGPGPEVHHQGFAAEFAGLHPAVYSRPRIV